MISLTITMLLVLAYSVLGNNGVISEGKFYPKNLMTSFSKYHASKMPELDYYSDYETIT